ncbi:MAG: gamma-glutamyl-gamma-aminobutyrate hydrolase family protein [bacterium]|nr:gamma-glutamyl-gamma-aminobutyrate hydrolase family protein [bacterium]
MNDTYKHDFHSSGSSFDEPSPGSHSKSRPPNRRTSSRGRLPRKPMDKPQPGQAQDLRNPDEQRVAPSAQHRNPPRRTPSRSTVRKPAEKIIKPEIKPGITAPVIGLTTCYSYNQKPPDVLLPFHYIWGPYIDAIHEAGGIPVIVPVGLEGRYHNKIFDLLDGLLLTGGGDIDPNMYDSTIAMEINQVDPKKDHTEFDLFNLAFNKNIPILGICRGIQLINVALDGTLYQDIPSQVKMAGNHKPDFPLSETCHQVKIEPETRLYKALGESRIWVNSIHHQGIKLHGKGLVVNAKSNDGIIEGIEHPTKKWVVGVQWHPELMFQTDKTQAKLFKAFIDACK